MTALRRLLHRLGWHWWYWIGSVTNHGMGYTYHYVFCHLCPRWKRIRMDEGKPLEERRVREVE